MSGHYKPDCVKLRWMIKRYDDRHVLHGTDFGNRVLEDAEEEDDVEDNLHGLFPNTCRTLFQDRDKASVFEMREVTASFSDSDKEVPHKVPNTIPFPYTCSKCNKPYQRRKPMLTHEAKCEDVRQATGDYDVRKSVDRARRERNTKARAVSRLEEDSDAQRATRARNTEAMAVSRLEEDSDAQRANRYRNTEARRLVRKNVLEACGVLASGHENDAINQDAENFHRFTLQSLRFVTCACCAREDGNGTMVQRLKVSNDEHLVAIRYMRELHAEVAEKPWDHVRYQDLDADGLLPKKQYIDVVHAECTEGITFRRNDFICDKCVKALKKGCADFTKLAEDERPKLPVGMQGNFFKPIPFYGTLDLLHVENRYVDMSIILNTFILTIL